MTISARSGRALTPVAALAVALAGFATASAAPTRTSPKTRHRADVFHVSAKGHDNATCSGARPCATIAHAVKLAARGARISVAAGVYKEQVTVRKRVTLVAAGRAVIDAKGRANGILVEGAGAAGSVVQGFLVRNADQEGILAERTSRVTIRDNVVRGNDLGMFAKPQVGECAPQGPVPGDCGEGVHLMGVTHARVTGNVVRDNAGGILLTDEVGPTARNLISDNLVLNNLFDCGITLAGHNPKAVSGGTPHPAAGGVYTNTVTRNVVDGNGLLGEGGGILLAGPAPGTGVYGNRIVGNVAIGNGLAGVTLHSHAPGQDLNGNVITGNTLSADALAGNANGAPGDSDAGLTQTAGITLFSAVTPLSGTVVTGNTISRVAVGIWAVNVPNIDANANTFVGVPTPLVSH